MVIVNAAAMFPPRRKPESKQLRVVFTFEMQTRDSATVLWMIDTEHNHVALHA